MATTEQRSGFRLPWATDSQPDAGPDADAEAPSKVGPDSSADTPEANQPATRGKGDAPDDSPATTATVDPRDVAWPTADASPGPATGDAAPRQATAEVGATARPPNPLVAGLVRAMREAAEAARKEALNAVAQESKTRTEQIHAESADRNAEIRRAGDRDVVEIREWSKAQMARLREKTELRITERRGRLELECEDQAARIEHRIEFVRQSVGAYETRMEAFFETLMAEEDPARLAGFAEQMPLPPDLADEGDLGDWTPSHALDAARAAAAEAAALADLDLAEEDASGIGEDDSTDGPAPSRESASQAAPGSTEATTETRLSVVGLISVASIAGFKRAVARTPGVQNISVASGPAGEFVFTVHHVRTIDLRQVIVGLDGFVATVTDDEAGVLSVTASQPDDLA